MDIIEIYSRVLPTNILATALPNEFVLWMYRSLGRFSSTLVERRGEVSYANEYNGPEAIFSLTAQRYPVTKINIRLSFPDVSGPELGDMSCFVIRENAVKVLTPDTWREGGRCYYQISFRKLNQATVRCQWTNRRLEEYLTARAVT